MEQAFELLLNHIAGLYGESADNLKTLLFEQAEDGSLSPLPEASDKLAELQAGLEGGATEDTGGAETTDEAASADTLNAEETETDTATDEALADDPAAEGAEKPTEGGEQAATEGTATPYDAKVLELSGFENEEGFVGEQLLGAAFEHVRQEAEMGARNSGGTGSLPPTEDAVKGQPWYNNQINQFEIKIGALNDEVSGLNNQLLEQQNRFNHQLAQATMMEKLRLEFYDFVKQRNPLEANYKLFNDLVKGAFDNQFEGVEVNPMNTQNTENGTTPQGTKMGVDAATKTGTAGLQFAKNGELVQNPQTGNTMDKTEMFEQAYTPYFTDRTSGKQLQPTAGGGAKQVPKTPKGKGVSYKGKIYGSVKEVRADKELSQEEREKIIYKLNKA